MSEIRVECYAGHRPYERPLRFILGGRRFEVKELDGRWYSPDATYFRVRADDGNFYVLRHHDAEDFWTLDGFRAARHSATFRKSNEGENGMPLAELRRHERILVPGQQSIRVMAKGNGQVEGFATVVGLGGMYIRTPSGAPPGNTLRMKLEFASTSLEVDCTVRHVNERGMGVEFTGISAENERKLRHLLSQLKP